MNVESIRRSSQSSLEYTISDSESEENVAVEPEKQESSATEEYIHLKSKEDEYEYVHSEVPPQTEQNTSNELDSEDFDSTQRKIHRKQSVLTVFEFYDTHWDKRWTVKDCPCFVQKISPGFVYRIII